MDFMQGGDDVVVVVPVPVIPHGGPLGHRSGVLQGDGSTSVPAARAALSSSSTAFMALRTSPPQAGGDVLRHPGLAAALSAPSRCSMMAEAPLHGGQHVLGGHRLELKHGGAGRAPR